MRNKIPIFKVPRGWERFDQGYFINLPDGRRLEVVRSYPSDWSAWTRGSNGNEWQLLIHRVSFHTALERAKRHQKEA